MTKQIWTVKITKTGRPPVDFIRKVTVDLQRELQNEIFLSAEDTAQIMQSILMSSGYKLDKLANAIKAEFSNTEHGLIGGIGKIADLPKSDKGEDYWEAFNAGFKPGASGTYVPLGSFGGEAPDSNKSGGHWDVGAGNWTFLDTNQTKKPIPPLSYVDIGYETLARHISKAIDKFNKELEAAAK
ncbi:MAG TPA: hypothetical protein VMV43_01650 [Candidatus Nanopelagicaceae bacterium]|nr:hypothetical protein [Candidatus Nanopelagicaceae bacterium]